MNDSHSDLPPLSGPPTTAASPAPDGHVASSAPASPDVLAPPAEVVTLAEQRASARIERDWSNADELKARIEEAGWKVVDDGTAYTLAPLRVPDIVAGGRTLYGHPDAVPSSLDAPPTSLATVVVVADRIDEALAVTLAAIADEAVAGTQQVVVLDGTAAGDTEASALESQEHEIVWTAGSLRPGAALQAGARRATGEVIIAVAPGHVPSSDFVTALVAALDDPTVGVAGDTGLRSADLHHFDPAEAGTVTALAAGCVAFRRHDLIDRGPLDDRLHLASSVATWWSLVLRDEGEEAAPRSALALDLPFAHVASAETSAETETGSETSAGAAPPRDRRAVRDRYRISARFGGRNDLADLAAVD